jgi:hypothetical protein
MNRKIFFITLGYILSLVLFIVCTLIYIQHKDDKLWKDAADKLEKSFDFQGIGYKCVYTEYSNKQIKFVKSSNPVHDEYSYQRMEWEDDFSDIYQFFKIDEEYNGWKFIIVQSTFCGVGMGIAISQAYPSYVGYRRQEYSWGYNFIPSVKDCVEEAYDFFVNNTDSQFIEYYKKGNKNLVLDLINKLGNEYYSLQKLGREGRTFNLDEGAVELDTYMYNGYYKVFIERTVSTTYGYVKQYSAIERDKETKLIIGIILLTIIFVSIIIAIIISYNRKEKHKKELLFNKLKNKCNPVNFMNPYNEKKVEKANIIFELLMKTNHYDIDALKRIRKKAIDELNLNFIDEDYLTELKNKCNPNQFLNPYNAEKFRMANMLYSKLISNKNNIEIIDEIENEINEFLKT